MSAKTTKCFKCKKTLLRKDFLRCTVCNQVYCANVNCAKIPGKIFDLMSPGKRKNWKCRSERCKLGTPLEKSVAADSETDETTTEQNKKNEPIAISAINMSPNSGHNITQRAFKANIPVNNSFEQLPVEGDGGLNNDNEDQILSSTLLNTTRASLPNLSVDNQEVTELRAEIDKLKTELDKEREVFENVSLENIELSKMVRKQKKSIEVLTQLLLTDTHGNCSLENSPLSNKNNSKVMSTRKKKYKQLVLNLEKELQENDFKSQDALNKEDYTSNYDYAGERAQTGENNLKNEKCSDCNQKLKQKVAISEAELEIEYTLEEKIESVQEKRKICIISSDNRYNTLNTTREHFEKDEICHHLITGGGIIQLLQNIDMKLKDFTLNDYCIILIGKSDFLETKNYSSLVDYIRNELRKVQNTNVILCLPTFKQCSKHKYFFNNRIETFNNLLYIDNKKHEYAYLLDSNRNLEYSRIMFAEGIGFLNRVGFRQVFRDVANLIIDIDQLYDSFPTSKKFFRE